MELRGVEPEVASRVIQVRVAVGDHLPPKALEVGIPRVPAIPRIGRSAEVQRLTDQRPGDRVIDMESEQSIRQPRETTSMRRGNEAVSATVRTTQPANATCAA